ncbi:hypothetical protein GGH13_000659 [Coemansia sp. S155-1]|nr:hypothetical protein GGH13_000659 [Coemansia sp. S155-1]
MVKETYVGILKDYHIPMIPCLRFKDSDFIFQQDNDPKHTSKLAKQWIENHDVCRIDTSHRRAIPHFGHVTDLSPNGAIFNVDD